MISTSKGEAELVLRRIKLLMILTAMFMYAGLSVTSYQIQAQEKPVVKEKPKVSEAQLTAEQVVEFAIYLHGGREGMALIRRSGVERGRITRKGAEGKLEEATYERRFIRGASMDQDRVRLDQKMPTAEYALISTGGQVWGLINGAMFTPRQEATQDFMMRQVHGVDTLLRYKENGSTIQYLGKEKHMGLDLHVVDVTDKEQRRTRFYVSAKSARILWLEFEWPGESGATPVKYSRKFHDYRLAQSTLVPYRSVLYRDGAQVEETQIMTITYGQKMDEALFRNPDSPPTTASKP